MANINRFIEKFPDSLAVDFRNLLKRFRDREISEAKIQSLMKEKIKVACNTIRPNQENPPGMLLGSHFLGIH